MGQRHEPPLQPPPTAGRRPIVPRRRPSVGHAVAGDEVAAPAREDVRVARLRLAVPAVIAGGAGALPRRTGAVGRLAATGAGHGRHRPPVGLAVRDPRPQLLVAHRAVVAAAFRPFPVPAVRVAPEHDQGRARPVRGRPRRIGMELVVGQPGPVCGQRRFQRPARGAGGAGENDDAVLVLWAPSVTGPPASPSQGFGPAAVQATAAASRTARANRMRSFMAFTLPKGTSGRRRSLPRFRTGTRPGQSGIARVGSIAGLRRARDHIYLFSEHHPAPSAQQSIAALERLGMLTAVVRAVGVVASV